MAEYERQTWNGFLRVGRSTWLHRDQPRRRASDRPGESTSGTTPARAGLTFILRGIAPALREGGVIKIPKRAKAWCSGHGRPGREWRLRGEVATPAELVPHLSNSIA